MSEKELRELDAFIAEHVMGWKRSHSSNPPAGQFYKGHTDLHIGVKFGGQIHIAEYRPTTDPAAAMEVWKLILESQSSLNFGDVIHSKDGNNFWFRTVKHGKHIDAEAETLELAICLFAKKVFSSLPK